MRRSVLRSALALAASALVAVLAVIATAASETPPPGPPWTREFAAAQRDALARGVPMFVYLTKTH